MTSLVSAGNASLSVGGTLLIQGGSAPGAAAFIDPQAPGSLLSISAAGITLTAGSADNAYAAIWGNGDIAINLTGATPPQFNPGTGVNRDAVIFANGGTISLNLQCAAAPYPCAAQPGNPLTNLLSDSGWFANNFLAGGAVQQQFVPVSESNGGGEIIQAVLGNLLPIVEQVIKPVPKRKEDVVVEDDTCE